MWVLSSCVLDHICHIHYPCSLHSPGEVPPQLCWIWCHVDNYTKHKLCEGYISITKYSMWPLYRNSASIWISLEFRKLHVWLTFTVLYHLCKPHGDRMSGLGVNVIVFWLSDMCRFFTFVILYPYEVWDNPYWAQTLHLAASRAQFLPISAMIT